MSDPQNDTNLAASTNPADERRAQLAALIPEAFSEGKLDLVALKRALGERVVIEGGERYALTWAGKSDAYKVLQTPSTATLRPERDKSVNFDQAQHVFIEGENLEVLKVLQKAYFGKVKLIYIDPPYNTGSDSFIYPDRFQESKEDYLKRINDLADDGTLMREGFFRKNSKESGHYHSNWLSMMLPRLYIARNLLREDGVIFVSCDDNEVHNLRCLMNEVFGDENFVAQFVWKARQFTDARATTNVSTDHEYLLAYSRTSDFSLRGIERDETKFTNPDNDTRGPWMSRSMLGLATKDQRPNLHYEIVEPSTGRVFPPNPATGWRYSEEKMKEMIREGRVLFPAKDDGRPREKKFRQEMQSDFIAFRSIIDGVHTADGTQEVRELFGAEVFPFPKPSGLIAQIAEQVLGDQDVFVDFFAGSASSFDAIARLNARNGVMRKSVLVQLPELVVPESEAAKAGYTTIADIARDRIRRVITRTRESADLVSTEPKDIGFKSFLLAPSNFKQWRGDGIDTPEQLAEQMQMFAKSEKEGAQVEDMLYELLLRFGQELTTPIEPLEVGGGKVFAIHGRKMLFVLESFTEAMILPLVEMKPREIIAIDGVFNDTDMLKTNLDLQCRDAGIRFTCL
ncbi:site-specific DNA-methyltransferase [Thiobacillus sp.]|uniref:site-specific DNA-methyltransferase n=1 Tax=Thiobacillus sp. TaxID=924 RepID=UPI00092C0EC8|nr:site-specific DNA-methyltransferase [Thiobacillus sp.]OJW35396.1 MAG: site-specific DNA-methyltransferase [Thiobacillus sp. 65-69]MBC2731178.1 site-specific DNA-methyltransferase [Thiobacillus sp.]MBC2739915.1 site-specific DNA-methyltransferase [Thiobacillus sp.]MBC2758910.1 site-specific DNA-methyltransferase [Thiobacillus sp.]TXH76846.1 MAG: site-specific DNA-methyltransferase [Thiobacillus sp.]